MMAPDRIRDSSTARLRPRIAELCRESESRVCRDTDRRFSLLLASQWAIGIIFAAWVSPLTWAGETSQLHPHLWAATLLGGFISGFPICVARLYPGQPLTRHVIAVGQILTSALWMHLTGGRIETHFHVFGSLAFLAFYRDWRVLVTASAVAAIDHLFRGYYWPMSVYGTMVPSSWRWLEHAAWVGFEDVFLMLSIAQVRTETRKVALRQARLERTNIVVEQAVRARTEELRTSEERLRQSQKMEAVGRLAGGIAHDFNNLLTVINGYCELLQDDSASGPAQQPLLSEIKHAGDRASALTRQLLAFGHKQVLSTRLLSVNTLVTDIEKMLRRLIGEHIDFRTSLAPDVWPVLADQGQLEQVVMNLAINARDAMPSGGRLTITTNNVAHDQKSLVDQRELPAGDFVMLSVSDTGCGMTTEVKQRIFEPFFTTKELGKGTGLGLAVVYGIVKQSGGFIHVVSEPSHGSVFLFYLPRHHELDMEAPDTMTHSDFTNFCGDETVLLVEDDDAVRHFTSAILRRAGYLVVEAADGREALEKCRSQNLSCDLVVTDVIMPGLSGSQLADELRAWRPGLRVLFISGYTDNSIDADDLAVPGTAFLAKPFASEPLARKVRELLDLPVLR